MISALECLEVMQHSMSAAAQRKAHEGLKVAGLDVAAGGVHHTDPQHAERGCGRQRADSSKTQVENMHVEATLHCMCLTLDVSLPVRVQRKVCSWAGAIYHWSQLADVVPQYCASGRSVRRRRQ